MHSWHFLSFMEVTHPHFSDGGISSRGADQSREMVSQPLKSHEFLAQAMQAASMGFPIYRSLQIWKSHSQSERKFYHGKPISTDTESRLRTSFLKFEKVTHFAPQNLRRAIIKQITWVVKVWSADQLWHYWIITVMSRLGHDTQRKQH